MAEELQSKPPEDLEDPEMQEVADLPDREAMSLVNANLAVPINAALAANILSDHAAAGAGAVQQDPIGQGILGGATPPTPAGQ